MHSCASVRSNSIPSTSTSFSSASALSDSPPAEEMEDTDEERSVDGRRRAARLVRGFGRLGRADDEDGAMSPRWALLELMGLGRLGASDEIRSAHRSSNLDSSSSMYTDHSSFVG